MAAAVQEELVSQWLRVDINWHWSRLIAICQMRLSVDGSLRSDSPWPLCIAPELDLDFYSMLALAPCRFGFDSDSF